MRINETPPLNITRMDSGSPVTEVAGVSAIGSQGQGAAAPGPIPYGRDQPMQASPTAEERRQASRRNEERRKRQLKVLMDTRVRQRRTARRRNQDLPPDSSVDIQA